LRFLLTPGQAADITSAPDLLAGMKAKAVIADKGYLNRRCGRESVDYIHPACKPTLERTLGVPLFQEQVLRMAMDVAGFSGSEADELRRAMAYLDHLAGETGDPTWFGRGGLEQLDGLSGACSRHAGRKSVF
jgi:hypothetical protein